MSNDFANIFAVDTETMFRDDKTESVFYTPSAKDGKDKVYEAKVKFLPYIFDTNLSLIDKYITYLTNPTTDDKRSIDCPSTVKKESLLQKAFFELRDSGSPIDQSQAKYFSRTRQCYSPVLIIEDEHKPELVGKIKIFRYGQQIYEILQSIIKHKDPDERNNPFDIFKGRTLNIKVIEKANNNNQKMNNFSGSSFATKVHPIVIDGKTMECNKADVAKIQEWLTENTPRKMEVCVYKEWDDDTRKFVVDAMNEIITDRKILNKLLKKTSSPSTAKAMEKNIPVVNDDEDILMDKPTKTPPKAEKVNVKTELIDDEDFDDLLLSEDDD